MQYILGLLTAPLTHSISEKLGTNSFLLLAPTGVAATNIDGATIHSVLKIPIQMNRFKPLSGERAREFCNVMESVSFLIIDEYSMIGLSMLAMIDARCKEGKGNDIPFGGLCVYLLGDIKQLPPVKDYAMYSLNCKSDLALKGKAVFQTIQGCVQLTICQRQKDHCFQEILDRLSTGENTQEDYKVLSKRFITSVPAHEEAKFQDAIHLFATKEEVGYHNFEQLKSVLKPNSNELAPIAKIYAKHNCLAARKASSEEAGGLENKVYLPIGGKMMLKSNLWVSKGLVNGSVGEVVDFLYDVNEHPPHDMPKVILCRFQSYHGPGIGHQSNIVPIPPILKTWTNSEGQHCSRLMFPLVLCYACSIHKSQGLTLEKVSQ